MRSRLTLVLLLLAGYGESRAAAHTHDGFYLSMNLGPAVGPIVLEAQGAVFRKMTFSGGGPYFDFKVGGALTPNVILHGDVIGHYIAGPDLQVDGVKGSSNSGVAAGGNLIGGGAAYYFMPVNIFLDATLGAGLFTIQDNNNNLKGSSERGFAFALKAGKEWWVSDNWGLGVSAGLYHLAANDKKNASLPAYSGKITSNKLFVLFNTTFN